MTRRATSPSSSRVVSHINDPRRPVTISSGSPSPAVTTTICPSNPSSSSSISAPSSLYGAPSRATLSPLNFNSATSTTLSVYPLLLGSSNSSPEKNASISYLPASSVASANPNSPRWSVKIEDSAPSGRVNRICLPTRGAPRLSLSCPLITCSSPTPTSLSPNNSSVTGSTMLSVYPPPLGSSTPSPENDASMANRPDRSAVLVNSNSPSSFVETEMDSPSGKLTSTCLKGSGASRPSVSVPMTV